MTDVVGRQSIRSIAIANATHNYALANGDVGHADTLPRAGHLVVIGITGAGTLQKAPTIGSGFTNLPAYWSNDSFDTYIRIAYKELSADETSFDVTWDTTHSTSPAGIDIYVFKNFQAGNPICNSPPAWPVGNTSVVWTQPHAFNYEDSIFLQFVASAYASTTPEAHAVPPEFTDSQTFAHNAGGTVAALTHSAGLIRGKHSGIPGFEWEFPTRASANSDTAISQGISIRGNGAAAITRGAKPVRKGYKFVTGSYADFLGLDLTAGFTGSAPADKDLVTLAVATGAASGKQYDQPTGWAQFYPDRLRADTDDSYLTSFHKFMGPSPDASVDLIATDADSTSSGVIILVEVFSGVDPDAVMDARMWSNGINTMLPTFESINPQHPDALVMAHATGSHSGGARVYAASGATTLIQTSVTSTADQCTLGSAIYPWTSGTFAPANWTLSSGSDSTGSAHNEIIFSLLPAPVAAGPAKVKVWNGSAWVEKPLKRWDGSQWITEVPKVYRNGAFS